MTAIQEQIGPSTLPGNDVCLEGATMPEMVATLRALQDFALDHPTLANTLRSLSETTASNVRTIATLACCVTVATDYSQYEVPTDPEYPQSRNPKRFALALECPTTDFDRRDTTHLPSDEMPTVQILASSIPDLDKVVEAELLLSKMTPQRAQNEDSNATIPPLGSRIEPPEVTPEHVQERLQKETASLQIDSRTTWVETRIVKAALRRYARVRSGYERAVALSALSERSAQGTAWLEKAAVYIGIAAHWAFFREAPGPSRRAPVSSDPGAPTVRLLSGS